MRPDELSTGGYRAPRLQSLIVTRSSCPLTVPAPVAPGAPPYWLKYGRSLMALPARVNSVHTIPKNITTTNTANVPLPPASARTVMQPKLGRSGAVLCDVAYVLLQQEELGRDVGLPVDLAQERARPASRDLLDRVLELVPEQVLEGGANVTHELALAALDQR